MAATKGGKYNSLAVLLSTMEFSASYPPRWVSWPQTPILINVRFMHIIDA